MLTYVKGDATNPTGDGKKIICHVCNDIGAWGAGFVLALSKKWKEPEQSYKDWKRKNPQDFVLGAVQFVKVAEDIEVANMIGQHNIRMGKDGTPPIRYDAIRTALRNVAVHAKVINASVHAPRFGAGLAGGNWNEIETIIHEELVNQGISVTVYDFN